MAAPVPVLPHGVWRRGQERAKDGTLGHLERPRQAQTRSALATSHPHRLLACQPAATVVGGLHRRVTRRGGGGYRHDHSPVWPGPRGPMARFVEGREGLALQMEELGARFRQTLHQMTASGDLRCRGIPLPCALGSGVRALVGEHLDARVRLEPWGSGLRGAVRSQGDGPPAVQVKHRRARRLTLVQGDLGNPEPGRGAMGRPACGGGASAWCGSRPRPRDG
jgi:hypothetical protein